MTIQQHDARKRGGQRLANDVTSAQYDHCVTVYNAMLRESKPVPTGEQDGEGEELYMIVYEGKLTGLFQDLRLSVPYYTSVRRALMALGCIRQLRRGGGTALSQWEMIREPDEDEFNTWYQGEPKGPTKAEKKARGDMLADQINNINTRLNMLEQQYKNLIHGLQQGGG